MSKLQIGSIITITNASHVTWSLSGGTGSSEPSVTCEFSMPATENISLVAWMLKKQSEDRYQKVVVETHDRDGIPNKKWTMDKAYIASYTETENAMGHVSELHVTMLGVLSSGTTYDGTNVLKVEAGKAENKTGKS
jgi:hypothetical protein